MLIVSGSKCPTAKDRAYVNQRTVWAPHGISRWTPLETCRVLGFALARCPLPRGRCVGGTWSQVMHPTKTTKTGTVMRARHWRWVHVLRFHNTVAAPWLHQGLPKPLKAYGTAGQRLLEWVSSQLQHGMYTVAQ